MGECVGCNASPRRAGWQVCLPHSPLSTNMGHLLPTQVHAELADTHAGQKPNVGIPVGYRIPSPLLQITQCPGSSVSVLDDDTMTSAKEKHLKLMCSWCSPSTPSPSNCLPIVAHTHIFSASIALFYLHSNTLSSFAHGL